MYLLQVEQYKDINGDYSIPEDAVAKPHPKPHPSVIQGPVASAGSSTAEAGEAKKTEGPAPKIAGEQVIIKTENPSASASRDPSPLDSGDRSPSLKAGEETDSSSVRTDTLKPQSKSPEPVSETTPPQLQQSEPKLKLKSEPDTATASSEGAAPVEQAKEGGEQATEGGEQAMEVQEGQVERKPTVEAEQKSPEGIPSGETEGKPPGETEGKPPGETEGKPPGQTEGKLPEDQVEPMETESSGGDGEQKKEESGPAVPVVNGRWHFHPFT